jgi:hypothetical protein
MNDLGKLLIALGGALVLVGLLVILLGRAHLPLGRLPGDLTWRGKHSTVYFPVMTCIVVSLLLTLVMWIINLLRR